MSKAIAAAGAARRTDNAGSLQKVVSAPERLIGEFLKEVRSGNAQKVDDANTRSKCSNNDHRSFMVTVFHVCCILCAHRSR